MKHLILLPGALGLAKDFDPYLLFLNKHFLVHTIELPGHGHRQLSPNGILIPELVNQLHQYIEDNHIDQAHIFGYSLGGYIALAYGVQYPQKTQSILTLATKLNWTSQIAEQEIKMLDPITIIEKVPKYAQLLSKLHGDKWKALLAQVASMMLDLGTNPILDQQSLSTLSVPAQLMVGDWDKMVSVAETQTHVQYLPNAKFAVLPGTQHPFTHVQRGLLMDLMGDFWKFESYT